MPAVALIASVLQDDIRDAYKKDLLRWFRQPALRHWHIAIQQLLRSRGFDGEYFGINRLDDIFVPLVEEALNLR